MVFNLFGKSAGRVQLILHSNLFRNLEIVNFESITNDLMQLIIILWCIIQHRVWIVRRQGAIIITIQKIWYSLF